jgi:hypothetical protein
MIPDESKMLVHAQCSGSKLRPSIKLSQHRITHGFIDSIDNTIC